MKTQSLLTALFLSSALITTACTPRDVPVSDGIKTVKQKGRDGAAASSEEFAISNFPIASFIGERHIEAIELVKLATGSLDAKRTQYTSEASVRDGGLAVTTIKGLFEKRENPLKYRSNAVRWDNYGPKVFEATFEKDGVVRNAEIKGVGTVKTSLDSKLKKRNFVNLNEKSYQILVTPVDAENVQIELKTTGELYGAKGGDGASKAIELSVKMVVNAASLETDEVKVVTAESIMYYPNINPKNQKRFEMPLKAKDLVVKIDALCSSLTGKASATAGKFAFDISFSATEITIDKNEWFSELGACGTRPTVDLSRFLVL